MLRQVIYQSRLDPAGPLTDMTELLREAQQLNAIDGITGLLYADGERFLQVLEGPDESVGLTYARICADKRHHHIETLVDRAVAAREFGDWTMADRSTRHARDVFDIRMRSALTEASAETRFWFEQIIQSA